MNFPMRLVKGNKIGIVAPSSPVTHDEANMCRVAVEKMGYSVLMGDSVYKSIHGYSAGTGEERAEDLNKMFSDKNVKAIWCIRGGDSSSHIIDKLDYDMIGKNPKIFVGYSDVTNIHICLNQRCNLVTFHGPMVLSNILYKYDRFTRQSFISALNMERDLVLKNPGGEVFKTIAEGIAQGIIVGGNLSLIVSMLATPYSVDTEKKVLFIEDIDEDVRKIDRMMYQLKYSGKLDDAAGIIIGDFTECNNAANKDYTVEELFRDIFSDYKKPVMYNIKSGHCFPMSTIPLGSFCTMDTKSNSILFTRKGD